MQAFKPDTSVRALCSGTLFVALSSALCCIVYLLFRSLAQSHVPDLGKFCFPNKADVVVICYRPVCGCEAHTIIWTGQALERKKQVLLLTTNNQSLIDRLSPSGKTTVSHVDYGKIVGQAAGGSALQDVLASDENEGNL